MKIIISRNLLLGTVTTQQPSNYVCMWCSMYVIVSQARRLMYPRRACLIYQFVQQDYISPNSMTNTPAYYAYRSA